MYSILVADEDGTLLDNLRVYFSRFANNLELHTARNGMDTVRVLEMKPVDLVVSEIMMLETVFSYVKKNFPSIPTIVMSGSVTPEVKQKLKNLGSPVFLKKPLNFEELKNAIFTKLQQPSGKGSIAGVSLTSFIQYISLEGKTCLVEVQAPGKKSGYIYFNKGTPWNAIWEDMRGREAAIEIISWENTEINFHSLPAKKIKRGIESELIGLIIEAERYREEKIEKEKLVGDNKVKASEVASVLPIDGILAIREQDIVDKIVLEAPSPENGKGEIRLVEHNNTPFVLKEEKQDEGKIIKGRVLKLESEILAGFLNISGVEAVLVVGRDGAVVHSSAHACYVDIEKAGTSSAAVWNGVAKMGGELGIGGFQSLMLESDDAVIVGAPIKDNLLVILARDARKLGMIRMRIKKQMPDLEKEIRNQRSEITA